MILDNIESKSEGKAKISEISESFGTLTLKGKKVEPEPGKPVDQSIFPIGVGKNAVIIGIQHTRNEDGSLKPESVALLKMLKDTFKLDEK